MDYYDGVRHPNSIPIKIDENTFVFGIQRNEDFAMVAVGLTGHKIQERWHLGDIVPVTKENWDRVSDSYGTRYVVEDVSFDCGKAIS